MSWKFQAIRYLWVGSGKPTPQFSLGLPNVLDGAQGCHLPDGRAFPIKQLFALEGRLRAGALAWDPRDLQHHVRGPDLIFEYPYSEETPTGVDCYWRPEILDGGGMLLEWFVSANTRLLDENIEWTVASEFEVVSVEAGATDEFGHCSEFSPLAEGLTGWESSPSTWESPLKGQTVLVMKLHDEAGWLAMAAASGDQRQVQVEVTANGNGGLRVSVRYALQMGFLEKGVIRRARLWFLWLPIAVEARDQIQHELQNFFCSPQPLTV